MKDKSVVQCYCGCMKRSLPGCVQVGQNSMEAFFYSKNLMSMYELCLHTNAACQHDGRKQGCCHAVLQPGGNALHLLAFCLSRKGSSTKVGAVHGMSEESLPDGCSNSGQKKVP